MSHRLTAKGQVTIPIAIRRLLGIKPGDYVVFEERADGEIEMRKLESAPVKPKE